MFKEMDVEEGKKTYETKKDEYIWLDVRTIDEFNEGHIPGCLHIPIEEIEDRLAEVGPKESNYIIYCAAGARSAAVCGFLETKGYKNLINLSEGMNEWTGPKE